MEAERDLPTNATVSQEKRLWQEDSRRRRGTPSRPPVASESFRWKPLYWHWLAFGRAKSAALLLLVQPLRVDERGWGRFEIQQQGGSGWRVRKLRKWRFRRQDQRQRACQRPTETPRHESVSGAAR